MKRMASVLTILALGLFLGTGEIGSLTPTAIMPPAPK